MIIKIYSYYKILCTLLGGDLQLLAMWLASSSINGVLSTGLLLVIDNGIYL